MDATETTVRTDDAKYRYLAALSYVNVIFAVIMLVLDSGSNYVRYHANQSLCLTLWFAASSIVAIVPILGWIAAAFGFVAGIVFVITAIVRVLKHEPYQIPWVGKWRIIPEA